MSSICMALARSKDEKDNFEAILKLTVRKALRKSYQDLYSVYLERILPNPNYSKTFYNGHNKELAISVFKDVIHEDKNDMNYIIERDWTTESKQHKHDWEKVSTGYKCGVCGAKS